MADSPKTTHPLKRLLMLAAGWVFLLLGIAGLVLPILQGILFIVIGLSILSTEYGWSRKLLAKLQARFPAGDRAARRAMEKLRSWLPHSHGGGPAT